VRHFTASAAVSTSGNVCARVQLRRRGYTVVAWGEPTDLLVVNTCSVTAEAERTCRYVIRKTLKHSPDAFVAVTGCYAQTGMNHLRNIPGIDLIVGNQFKSDLPSFLPPPEVLRKQPTPEVLHTRTIAARSSSSRVRRVRCHPGPIKDSRWMQRDAASASFRLQEDMNAAGFSTTFLQRLNWRRLMPP
jgi:hypothetical protein